jgi:hydrogenase expression/formation protein HypC
MCLAIPGKILERTGDTGKVDFGGVVREANLSLVDAGVGEYVVVHAGFAIQKIDEQEALETLDMFKQILEEP